MITNHRLFLTVCIRFAAFAFVVPIAPAQSGGEEAVRFLDVEGAVYEDETSRTAAFLELALNSGDPAVSQLAAARFLQEIDRAGLPKDALATVLKVAADPLRSGFHKAAAVRIKAELLLRAGAFDPAEKARGEDGLIRDFMVVGPIGSAYPHYGGVVFEPERVLDFAKTYAGTEGPVSFVPYAASFSEGSAEVGYVVRRTAGCVYAVAVLAAGEDVDLDVVLGTPGSAELFVDGRRALVIDRALAYLPTERSVRVRFPAGSHRLMVKTLTTDARSFRLSLRSTTGAPVDLSASSPSKVKIAADAVAFSNPVAATAYGTGENRAFVVTDVRDLLKRPDLPENVMVAAMLVADAGLPDQALAAVAKFEAPESAAATASRAGVLIVLRRLVDGASETPEAERKARGLALARRLMDASPGHPAAVVALAEEETANDRGEKALAAIEAALVDRPKDILLRTAYIKTCETLGFKADVERGILALAAACPDSAEATTRLFASLRARGDVDGADRVIAEVLKFDHSADFVRADLIRRLALKRKFDEARALQEITRRLSPYDESAAVLAADLAREAGDVAAERAILAAAADMPPRFSSLSLKRLADQAVLAGDGAEAAKLIREILRRDPDGEPGLRKTLAELAPDANDYFAEFAADVPALLKGAPATDVYPDAAVVLLLDQVILHIRADGTARHEVHQLHRLQDPRGRDALGRIAVEGEPLVVRTIAADGRTLWPNSLRQGQYEMAGLAKGVVVERRYRYEVDRFVGEPVDFGGFYFQDTEGEAPFHLTRYIVVVPKALGLEPTLERFPGTPVKTERGDDVVYEFKLERMPRIKRERAMPPTEEIAPYVSFRKPGAFAELNRRILQQFETDARPNAALVAAALKACGDAKDPLEKARRLYAFVCESVPTEDGGGSPAVTLAERAGPRLPLYAALLSAADVPWRPCFVRPAEKFTKPERVGVVDFSAFSAGLVRVEPPGLPPVYVDAGLRFRPFGELPYVLADAAVFVADRNGGFLDRTPALPLVAATDMERTFDLTLRADGVAVGTATLVFGPEASAQLKDRLADADRSEYEPALLRLLLDPLGRLSPKATAKATITGVGKDGGPLTVSAPIELKKLLKESAGGGEIASPIAPLKVARRFVDRTARTHPVVFRGIEVSKETATIRLDSSWRATGVPEGVTMRGPLGAFVLRRTLDDSGQILTFERSVRFEPFTLTAADFPAFADWLSALDAEEERQVRVEKGGP